MGNGAALIVNFELPPSHSKLTELVQEMTDLISTNNYALLICGLLIMSISVVIVSLGCYCRRKSYKKERGVSDSLLNNLGKSSNGFHRYKDLDDDEEDEMESIRRNINDGSKNRISLNMNTTSCRYTKLEDTDSKKLLVESDDEDDENEEKVFVR